LFTGSLLCRESSIDTRSTVVSNLCHVHGKTPVDSGTGQWMTASSLQNVLLSSSTLFPQSPGASWYIYRCIRLLQCLTFSTTSHFATRLNFSYSTPSQLQQTPFHMVESYVQENRERVKDLESKPSNVWTIRELGQYAQARNVVVGSTSTNPWSRNDNLKTSRSLASRAEAAEDNLEKASEFRADVESFLADLAREEKEVSWRTKGETSRFPPTDK
jgi:hypothetical protein